MIELLLAKLKEESTWRGMIAVVLSLSTALGFSGVAEWLTPERQVAILGAGLGLIGLINIIKKQPLVPPK